MPQAPGDLKVSSVGLRANHSGWWFWRWDAQPVWLMGMSR